MSTFSEAWSEIMKEENFASDADEQYHRMSEEEFLDRLNRAKDMGRE